ncbi:hypothetical protein [Nocardia sp. NBC_01327]|uniref:hypothetical protein n=1 Tax=Nocardia sp. NBC_01327 TaxID=2903593 RepID=UPI002E0F4EC2|nr:hypothetical protein OG326_42965 [Nocardia sp. NBC_01327]
MARKGAFNDDDLNDIDDLLPPSPPAVAIQVAPPAVSAPVSETAADTGEIADSVAAQAKPTKKAAAKAAVAATEPATRRARPAAARTRAIQSVPEAHVASVVAEALRQLTHAERTQRGEGRSYGEVVLDAIEQHEQELVSHFSATANAKPAGRLFKRVDTTRPRRRRHAEPPVKIPLSGIIASDMEAIDELVITWQTGSRSALVDQALKLYLAEDIARLAGESDDEEALESDSATV